VWCSLWGTDWIVQYYLDELQFRRVKLLCWEKVATEFMTLLVAWKSKIPYECELRTYLSEETSIPVRYETNHNCYFSSETLCICLYTHKKKLNTRFDWSVWLVFGTEPCNVLLALGTVTTSTQIYWLDFSRLFTILPDRPVESVK
jgi:hypothetical protein